MSKKQVEYWGLDLETSGSDHTDSALIQVGLYSPTGERFDAIVGGWDWADEHPMAVRVPGQYIWNLEAQGVHGLTKEDVANGISPQMADALTVAFVEQHSEQWVGRRIPVGWNIAGFDMPFVRQHLPGLGRMLSYRTLDLNAVTFATTQALGLDYGKLKSQSKDWAKEAIGGEASWHDAGYDAEAGVMALSYLMEAIAQGTYPNAELVIGRA